MLGSVGRIPAGHEAEWLMTADDGFNGALRKAGAAVLRPASAAATGCTRWQEITLHQEDLDDKEQELKKYPQEMRALDLLLFVSFH